MICYCKSILQVIYPSAVDEQGGFLVWGYNEQSHTCVFSCTSKEFFKPWSVGWTNTSEVACVQLYRWCQFVLWSSSSIVFYQHPMRAVSVVCFLLPSCGCEILSHCGFNLHFLSTSEFGHFFFIVYWAFLFSSMLNAYWYFCLFFFKIVFFFLKCKDFKYILLLFTLWFFYIFFFNNLWPIFHSLNDMFWF